MHPTIDMSVKQPDYVIQGGHLIDPFNNVDNVLTDVAILDGKVYNVGQGLMKGRNEVGWWNSLNRSNF